MKNPIVNIGITTKNDPSKVIDSLNKVLKVIELENKNFVLDCLIETEREKIASTATFLPLKELVEKVDLLVVIGGDGSLLKAGRIAAGKCPIVGINEGTVGFLADISVKNIDNDLKFILQGNYKAQERSILRARLQRGNTRFDMGSAVNDIVLSSSEIARMIEFSLYINDSKLARQRSDGMIIATPTGSTAYSLSAGGPVVHPSLNATLLVPLNPHTLSNRTIVIHNNDIVKLVIETDIKTQLSLDGQKMTGLLKGDEIEISKHDTDLEFYHPNRYNYFANIKDKLS